MKTSSVTVLIPAYNPDEKLSRLLDELLPLFGDVVVVNDGSTVGQDVFDDVRARGLPVLVHDVNRGKGAALKTGFAWIMANRPDCVAVVTADADGQHRPADIARVAEASVAHPRGLTLGVRAFTGKVPLRSRFGNWWTRQVFFVMTRLRVADTQTGLRGIPAALLPRMLELEKSTPLTAIRDAGVFVSAVACIEIRTQKMSLWVPVRSRVSVSSSAFLRYTRTQSALT